MTEGQDITEAYEAAHIRGDFAAAILKKYFVRKISKQRNSPYTFESNGFYQTLKLKAEKILYSAQVGGPGPSFKTFLLQDSLVLIFLALLACTSIYDTLKLAMLTGIGMLAMKVFIYIV